MADINLNSKPVVPYRTTPFPGWDEEVAKWPWELIHKDPPIVIWGKEGTCPYCGDHMSIIEAYRPIVPGLEVSRFIEATRNNGIPETVYVWCNCDVAHPPEATHQGCGQHARIPFGSALPNPEL